jgi:hypothetical protein
MVLINKYIYFNISVDWDVGTPPTNVVNKHTLNIEMPEGVKPHLR